MPAVSAAAPRSPVILLVHLLLLGAILAGLASGSGLQLAQVQAVFRHGDRTPLSAIPTREATWNCSDLYPQQQGYLVQPLQGHTDVLAGTCFSGQLTSLGRGQVLQAGKRMAGQYSSFLESVGEAAVTVRTCSEQRTVDSAIYFLQGLSLPFLVRSLYQVEPSHEDLTANPQSCPRVAIYILEHYRTYAPLLKIVLDNAAEIKQVFGIDDPFLAVRYYDNLFCRACHGISMPPGLSPALYEALHSASTMVNMLYTNDTYKALAPWFRDLVSNMAQASAEAPSVFLFSAHDTTVAPLLHALGLLDHWPRYADTVFLELWISADNRDRFVSFRYNDALLLELVPLSTFSSILLRDMPVDMKAFCALRT